jgi:hypothetical protein
LVLAFALCAPLGARAQSSEDDAAPAAAEPEAEPTLSDEARLDRVLSLYNGRFEECASELGTLLDPQAEAQLTDPKVVERARLHRAACLIRAGRSAEAAEPLRDALREDHNMKPPEAWIFGEPVVDLFFKVREELRDEIDAAEQRRIEAARLDAIAAARAASERRRHYQELVRLAARETVIERNRRWIASVPFGVGQFQNGDEALGYVFLTSEVALGATALGSMVVLLSLRDDAEDDNTDAAALNSVNDTAEALLTVSAWGFAVAATAGVLEAHLSFVPERRTTRRRPLPPELETLPQTTRPELGLRVTPFGAHLVGRF